MSGSSNANAPFPPSAPTSLQHLRTSSSVGAGAYLYEQYSDDDNVRAFFEAYNIIAEEYVEWFATVALPYWPGLSNGLLDWVANGLYGIYRPTLTFGTTTTLTSSSPQSGRSRMARATRRPIRPNPLMATFVIGFLLFS